MKKLYFCKKCIKENYGFTLVEVIISLAIFAIITVGFFGAFSTVYINLYKTSVVTENIFASQQELELKITEVKEKIDNNKLTEIVDSTKLISETTFTLFSGTPQQVSVSAYRIKDDIGNGQQLETVIGQNRPPKLETPNILNPENIQINVIKSGSVVKYPSIADKDNYDVILKNGAPEVDKPGYLIRFLYYWYISNPGVYTPYREPEFPNDYQILAGYSAKDILTLTDDFAGRFLKLLITPVGEKGAMGDTVESNAVYISKLPIIEDLQLHFDSSFIHHSIDSIYDGSTISVNKWNNIAPNYSSTLTSTPTLKPSLIYQVVNDSNRINIINNDSSTFTSYTTTYNPSTNSLTSVEKTIYFAIYLDPSIIVQNSIQILNSTGTNKFSLATNVVNNDVKLTLTRVLTSTNTKTVTTQKSLIPGKWNIVKMQLNNDVLSISNSLNLSNDVYSFDSNSSTAISPVTTSTVASLPLSIGLIEGYSLGETLIYTGRMTDDEDKALLKYLFEKYNP